MLERQSIANQLTSVLEAHQQKIPTNGKYYHAHQKLVMKRRVMEFYFMFLYQSLVTYFLPQDGIILPWYPPVAMALTLIYLRGARVVPILWIAGATAYLANHQSLASSFILSFSDVLSAFLGGIFCQNLIRSDVKPFSALKVFFIFAASQMIITAPISTWIKMRYLGVLNLDSAWFTQLFNVMPYWSSVVNGLLILPVYLLTWMYPPKIRFSWRQLIEFRSPIPYIILLCLMMLGAILSSHAWWIYVSSMPFLIWLAYRYQTFGATAGIFVISVIHLVHIILLHAQIQQTIYASTFYPPIILICVCFLHFVASLKKESK